jgi:hypothetical protein
MNNPSCHGLKAMARVPERGCVADQPQQRCLEHSPADFPPRRPLRLALISIIAHGARHSLKLDPCAAVFSIEKICV